MHYLRKIGREVIDWIKVTQDRIKVGAFVNKVAYIRIRLPDETTLKATYTLESSGALCNLLPNYISTVASNLASACLAYKKKTTPTHRLIPALVIGRRLSDLYASSTDTKRTLLELLMFLYDT